MPVGETQRDDLLERQRGIRGLTVTRYRAWTGDVDVGLPRGSSPCRTPSHARHECGDAEWHETAFGAHQPQPRRAAGRRPPFPRPSTAPSIAPCSSPAPGAAARHGWPPSPRAIGRITTTGATGPAGPVSFTSVAGIRGTFDLADDRWTLSGGGRSRTDPACFAAMPVRSRPCGAGCRRRTNTSSATGCRRCAPFRRWREGTGWRLQPAPLGDDGPEPPADRRGVRRTR